MPDSFYPYLLKLIWIILFGGNLLFSFGQKNIPLDWFSAASQQDTVYLKKLLAKGTPVDTVDEYGNTALYRCIYGTKYNPVVEFLLNNGADPNQKNKYGSPILHKAVRWENNLFNVKSLVKAGANVSARDTFSRTPLMEATTWLEIDTVVLQYLIEEGANINDTTRFGKNILQHMLDKRLEVKAEIVSFLIRMGANIHGIPGEDNPLALAVGKKWPKVVNLLINEGLAQRMDKETQATTLLQVINYQGGSLKILKILQRAGIPLDISNSKGLSLMLKAANYGHYPIFNYLYQYAPESIRGVDSSHNDLLICAVLGKNRKIINFLLNQPIDWRSNQDYRGYSALSFAKKPWIVKKLTAYGFSIDHKDHKGHNLFNHYCRENNVKLTRYLLNHFDVDLSDSSAHTAFTSIWRPEIAQFMAQKGYVPPPHILEKKWQETPLYHTKMHKVLLHNYRYPNRFRTPGTKKSISKSNDYLPGIYQKVVYRIGSETLHLYADSTFSYSKDLHMFSSGSAGSWEVKKDTLLLFSAIQEKNNPIQVIEQTLPEQDSLVFELNTIKRYPDSLLMGWWQIIANKDTNLTYQSTSGLWWPNYKEIYSSNNPTPPLPPHLIHLPPRKIHSLQIEYPVDLSSHMSPMAQTRTYKIQDPKSNYFQITVPHVQLSNSHYTFFNEEKFLIRGKWLIKPGEKKTKQEIKQIKKDYRTLWGKRKKVNSNLYKPYFKKVL